MSIAIDFDQIMAELKRLAREAAAFPTANEVAVSEGGTSQATADFRDAVSRVAQGMGAATQNSISALNDANEAIRFAVMEIAEQDAALADETKLIIALLDSAGKQAPAGGQSDAWGEEPEDMDF